MSPQSVKSPNPASGVQSPPGTSHHQTSASVVTGGIQAILEAEKEAQAIIEKARQYRIQRLKDARSEAIKELEQLKAAKSEEYSQFEQQFAAAINEHAIQCKKDSEREIVELNALIDDKRQLIIDKLINAVCLTRE